MTTHSTTDTQQRVNSEGSSRARSLARLQQLNTTNPELVDSYMAAIVEGDGAIRRWERSHSEVTFEELS